MNIELILSIVGLIIFAKIFWNNPGLTTKIIAILVIGLMGIGLTLLFGVVILYGIESYSNYLNNNSLISILLGFIVIPVGMYFFGKLIDEGMDKIYSIIKV